MADGSFRSDLLYRINGFQISLAPLRERPEDIETLAQHLLQHVGGTNPPALEGDAMEALRSYGWPGNVRQLKNCLERAVILANNGRITLAELPPEVARPTVSFTGLMASAPAGSDADSGSPAAASSPASLRDMERQQISPRLNRLVGIEARLPRFWNFAVHPISPLDYDSEKRR